MFCQCRFVTSHTVYKCNLPIKIVQENPNNVFYEYKAPTSYVLIESHDNNFSLAYFEGHFICSCDGYQSQPCKMHIILPSPRSRLLKFKAWKSRPVREDMHASLFCNIIKSCFRIQDGT